MKIKSLAAVSVLFAVASVASAQQSSQTGIGLSAGIYSPTSSQIRADLGNQAIQFGLGGAATRRPSEGSITPQYNIILANGNGNKLFILPFTYGYEYHFGSDTGSSFLPYVRPFAGIAYYDYSITDFASATHYSEKQIGGTYGIEAGILLSKKLKVSAAYNYFTPSNGLSFNGWSLSATYSLFNL
jgi:hypothetical protein